VGEYDERDFIVLVEDDPISTDGRNRWQEGIDKWLEGYGDPLYHPPKEKSNASVAQPTPEAAVTMTPTLTPTETPTPSL
jgi:hypothetical protein